MKNASRKNASRIILVCLSLGLIGMYSSGCGVFLNDSSMPVTPGDAGDLPENMPADGETITLEQASISASDVVLDQVSQAVFKQALGLDLAPLASISEREQPGKMFKVVEHPLADHCQEVTAVDNGTCTCEIAGETMILNCSFVQGDASISKTGNIDGTYSAQVKITPDNGGFSVSILVMADPPITVEVEDGESVIAMLIGGGVWNGSMNLNGIAATVMMEDGELLLVVDGVVVKCAISEALADVAALKALFKNINTAVCTTDETSLCGNNICEPEESEESCPADCVFVVCNNDGICDHETRGEDFQNCPADCDTGCNNNGQCEVYLGENEGNCADCRPPDHEQICDDGLDDDEDGWIDCHDPDCLMAAACDLGCEDWGEHLATLQPCDTATGDIIYTRSEESQIFTDGYTMTCRSSGYFALQCADPPGGPRADGLGCCPVMTDAQFEIVCIDKVNNDQGIDDLIDCEDSCPAYCDGDPFCCLQDGTMCVKTGPCFCSACTGEDGGLMCTRCIDVGLAPDCTDSGYVVLHPNKPLNGNDPFDLTPWQPWADMVQGCDAFDEDTVCVAIDELECEGDGKPPKGLDGAPGTPLIGCCIEPDPCGDGICEHDMVDTFECFDCKADCDSEHPSAQVCCVEDGTCDFGETALNCPADCAVACDSDEDCDYAEEVCLDGACVECETGLTCRFARNELSGSCAQTAIDYGQPHAQCGENGCCELYNPLEAPAQCDDEQDNDGDELVDCQDPICCDAVVYDKDLGIIPLCADDLACTCGDDFCDKHENTCTCPGDCPAPHDESKLCDNECDDDGDMLVDCFDAEDCSKDPYCYWKEVCPDGTPTCDITTGEILIPNDPPIGTCEDNIFPFGPCSDVGHPQQNFGCCSPLSCEKAANICAGICLAFGFDETCLDECYGDQSNACEAALEKGWICREGVCVYDEKPLSCKYVANCMYEPGRNCIGDVCELVCGHKDLPTCEQAIFEAGSCDGVDDNLMCDGTCCVEEKVTCEDVSDCLTELGQICAPDPQGSGLVICQQNDPACSSGLPPPYPAYLPSLVQAQYFLEALYDGSCVLEDPGSDCCEQLGGEIGIPMATDVIGECCYFAP